VSRRTSIVDSSKGALSLIVIADVVVLLILTVLVVWGSLPLYPVAAVTYPLLLLANVFLIRAILRSRQGRPRPSKRPGVPKLLWFGACAFTVSGVALIVAWVRDPDDLQSATQAAGGILLAAYAWFLVRRSWVRREH
jgi:hypothetical protein